MIQCQSCHYVAPAIADLAHHIQTVHGFARDKALVEAARVAGVPAPVDNEVARLALAAERVDLLATMVQNLRAELARKDVALRMIADYLHQRHQEGWEERLYDIARAALEAK
jgi:hypothetical protein